MRPRMRKWVVRLCLFAVGAVLLIFLVVIPVGLSILLTNARPPAGTAALTAPALPHEDVGFVTSDGLRLDGWWSAQADPMRASIVFVHGLYQSRLEMLDRAEAMHDSGFSTLLFDLRNHGQSDRAHTTLGVRERLDVCRAAEFVRSRHPDAPVVLWGVSMGAAAAILAADCDGVAAVISDSSFLSLDDTVRHHFREVFGLPAFPVADLLLWVTEWRMGFSPADGDVEAAVRRTDDIPFLFIAGGQDWRMPPEIARELLAASANPSSRLLLIEGATHGHAFDTDPETYLSAVRMFLSDVLPTTAVSPAEAFPGGGH